MGMEHWPSEQQRKVIRGNCNSAARGASILYSQTSTLPIASFFSEYVGVLVFFPWVCWSPCWSLMTLRVFWVFFWASLHPSVNRLFFPSTLMILSESWAYERKWPHGPVLHAQPSAAAIVAQKQSNVTGFNNWFFELVWSVFNNVTGVKHLQQDLSFGVFYLFGRPSHFMWRVCNRHHRVATILLNKNKNTQLSYVSTKNMRTRA